MTFGKFCKYVLSLSVIATIILFFSNLDDEEKNNIFFLVILRNIFRIFMLYFSYNFYKIIFVGLFRAVYNIGKMLFSPYRNYKSNQAMNNEELDKLEKLIILKMQGAITEDEFEEQKEKIMKKHKKTSR